MSIARVQARGQVTVPKDVREACGIEPGSDLLFRVSGTGFECRVLPAQRSLMEMTERYSVEDLDIDVEELRAEAAAESAKEFLQASKKRDAESA